MDFEFFMVLLLPMTHIPAPLPTWLLDEMTLFTVENEELFRNIPPPFRSVLSLFVVPVTIKFSISAFVTPVTSLFHRKQLQKTLMLMNLPFMYLQTVVM